MICFFCSENICAVAKVCRAEWIDFAQSWSQGILAFSFGTNWIQLN